MGIYSIHPAEYNKKLAEAIKKDYPEFKKPEWADFVKTSVHKQRPNVEPDFWFRRIAGILRQICIKKIVGVGRLRTRYGGKKKRGVKPAEFRKSGGKVIRILLQQAEEAGLVKKAEGKKAGRQLTSKGQDLLESIK